MENVAATDAAPVAAYLGVLEPAGAEAVCMLARMSTSSVAPYGAQWVGFNLRFGVKVWALLAVESGPVPVYGVSNRFKSLRKMAGKSEAAEGDADHIDRPGTHLGYHNRLRPTQVTSGVWVFAALR